MGFIRREERVGRENNSFFFLSFRYTGNVDLRFQLLREEKKILFMSIVFTTVKMF